MATYQCKILRFTNGTNGFRVKRLNGLWRSVSYTPQECIDDLILKMASSSLRSEEVLGCEMDGHAAFGLTKKIKKAIEGLSGSQNCVDYFFMAQIKKGASRMGPAPLPIPILPPSISFPHLIPFLILKREPTDINVKGAGRRKKMSQEERERKAIQASDEHEKLGKRKRK